MLSVHKQRNGKEITPFNGEVFERKDMGPFKKNLLIPKAAENKLKRNDRSGMAELRSLNDSV